MQTLEEIKQDNQWSFFSKSDPFNNNAVDGYISHHADDRYGALYITAVNGKEVPQYILCTPKLHYPFDKNGKYNWPKASRIERYVKYDGTNIFAFHYYDAFGDDFLTFKTRLMPFIGDTKNGPFLSMWRETLHKYPELTIPLYREQTRNVAYELFGCVGVGTKVLTANLKWVDVETLRAGDKIVSFDEFATRKANKRRSAHYYKIGTVISNYVSKRRCAKVTLSDGTVVVTTWNHPWFVQRGDKTKHWVETKYLRINQTNLHKLLNVWEEDTSKEAGWLAGLFDGEGTVPGARKKWVNTLARLYISQNPGLVTNTAMDMLCKKNYAVHYTQTVSLTGHNSGRMVITGGKHESLRFIGSIRPIRYLNTFSVEDMGTVTQHKKKYTTVVSKEDIGWFPVSLLEVDTGTYVANGYGMHNSKNPHLIKYDIPLTAKVLFARDNSGGIVPPTNITSISTEFCADLRGIITKDNYTEEYEKAQQEAQSKLKEVGEYVEGDEGEVWYMLVDNSWHMVKMKPEMIEQIHWAAGGIGKNIIVATCENSFENWDNPTVDNIVELLKEEFTPAEVDKVYYRIEKYLNDVKLRHEFRVGVLTKYQECGINITTDKISVMRAMSKIFPKEKMSQVYDIITHIK